MTAKVCEGTVFTQFTVLLPHCASENWWDLWTDDDAHVSVHWVGDLLRVWRSEHTCVWADYECRVIGEVPAERPKSVEQLVRLLGGTFTWGKAPITGFAFGPTSYQAYLS